MTEKDGVWRTISGRRVFIAKGQSLHDAIVKSGKFTGKKLSIKLKNKSTNQKSKSSAKTFSDGKDPSEKTYWDYTGGNHNTYISFANMAKRGEKYEDLDDFRKKMMGRKEYYDEACRLMDKIRSQEPSDKMLVRVELYPEDEVKDVGTPKEGDTLNWSIRSFSRNKDFAKKAVTDGDDGLPDFLGSKDTVVEYRTQGKVRGFDISNYSTFDQDESLVSGKFKVTKTEELNDFDSKHVVVYIEEVDEDE